MLKEMSIEIIRKCPNHCLHCSSSSSIKCNEMIPLDTFKKVVDSAANLHLQTVCFSGGEPFLHPNIVEMVEYVANKGLQSYIYTSGICINQSQMRFALSKELLYQIKDFVTKLIFNIEAASEDTYDRIMGTTGCFSYLQEAISNAIGCGIICEAHFVPMKCNINEIEQTIHFCENNGISKVSFLRLVPHGRALINQASILLSDVELKDLKEKLIKIQLEGTHSIRIGVPLSDNSSESHCEAALGKINIKYDGFVYPCEVFKNTQDFSLIHGEPESIYNKSLEEIYHHSIYLNNIRNYISSFCQSNSCENCAGQFYIQSLSKWDGEENAE